LWHQIFIKDICVRNEIDTCSFIDHAPVSANLQQLDGGDAVSVKQGLHFQKPLCQQGQTKNALQWQMPDDETPGRRRKTKFEYQQYYKASTNRMGVQQ
jgi:hypothetical protein